ncbi:helix-turn-helix domain-containing protein [Alkaliflexus imshenetskii]|uniref:helix-turn-helix domain-containing protein n=1 Tax=Alkaliflexus imshenetskii TaxID=286730 RepID=UPI000478FF10|nr:helix-turn-helix transcriptional regulator [Alkaliflexus imshenetskii]
MKKENTTTWSELKDQVYGKKGTERRDRLDREFKSLRVGLMLREAREKKQMTQDQLGQVIDKKRSFISRIENDASNMTLKTLYDIVEKGLGGKIKIQIEL